MLWESDVCLLSVLLSLVDGLLSDNNSLDCCRLTLFFKDGRRDYKPHKYSHAVKTQLEQYSCIASVYFKQNTWISLKDYWTNKSLQPWYAQVADNFHQLLPVYIQEVLKSCEWSVGMPWACRKKKTLLFFLTV